MGISRFEIAPYKLPETVTEARRSVMARKVMQLYGVVQPFFDYEDDIDLAQALDSHADRAALIAHEAPVYSEDDVKGFLTYGVDKRYRSMTIYNLAVEEALRAQGIGGALLASAESVAEDSGLWSVNLKSTDSAASFYSRKGYRMVDERERMFQLRLPRR